MARRRRRSSSRRHSSVIVVRSRTRTRRRRAKRNPTFGKHRPVLIYGSKGWKRPKRSRLKKGFRVNGRRRRRNPGMALSVGSVKSALSIKNLTSLMSMGGGFLVGMQLSAFLAGGSFFGMGTGTLSNAMWQKARPVQGLVHVIVGGMLASRARSPLVKNVAMGVAASGAYDVLAQILNMAGVKLLPVMGGWSMPATAGWAMPATAGWAMPARSQSRAPVVLGGFGDLSSIYKESA